MDYISIFTALLVFLVGWFLGSLRGRQQDRTASRPEAGEGEDRLLERERQRFFDLSLDMVCIAGVDGYFKDLSPAFEDTLGYTRDQFLAQPFLDFVHPEDREATLSEVAKLADGAPTIHFENRYRCRDGSYKWMAWNAMSDPERGLLYAMARDNTEQRRAVEAAAEARRAAESANRAKSQFLANMSHELRTPLNSVIGFANLLLRNKSGNLGAQELTYLERILANGKHLLHLINEVLDISKVEAGKIELSWDEVRLDRLVPEVIAELEGHTAAEVRLEAEVAAGLEPLRADPARLKQILINLVGNALKFTEEGSVTVRVAADADRRPRRIDVVDTGIGIPSSQLGEIFEPFQQVDGSSSRRFSGTGLGLAITRAFCQLMGFELAVASEVGKGSTFSIVFPGAAPGEGEKPKPAGDEPQAATAPGLILAIDDEADSRILLSSYIEDLGYRLVTASSGEEGLWMARRLRPALITLDLMMPEMSGWEVLKRLKADPELREIPVIIVTIVPEEERGGLLGAVDVLEKPIEREALERVLGRNLRHRPSKVLVVADQAETRATLVRYLTELELETREAADGAAALEALAAERPDLVIADLMMPVANGQTLLGVLRREPSSTHLPLVAVTARDLEPRELARLEADVSTVLRQTADLEEELRAVVRQILDRPQAG